MTPTQDRVSAVMRSAQEAAALLPPAPSTALVRHYPELAQEWRTLLLEAADLVAASVSHGLAALRSAIGPAMEVGVNPPWRMLLELALVVAHQGAVDTADPGLLEDTLAWVLAAPRRTATAV